VAKEEPKFKRGTQDLSASVKNVGVDGIDGLNVKWEAPFKFDEWVVGFKLALSDLRRAPETLFVKRTYDTPVVDGAATVDCSYNVASKVLSTDCTWVSKTSDLAVSVSGNTEDKLTKVGAAGSVRVAGEKLALEATRDLKNAKYSGSARVAHGDTSITVSYDSEENDPLLKVNHKLDNLNSVTPKISLKSGAASCTFLCLLFVCVCVCESSVVGAAVSHSLFSHFHFLLLQTVGPVPSTAVLWRRFTPRATTPWWTWCGRTRG